MVSICCGYSVVYVCTCLLTCLAIQTFRKFKNFASSIDAVYLVEASASLREIQKQLLCGADAALEATDIGHKSVSKHLGVPIIWVEDIRLLPYSKCRSR